MRIQKLLLAAGLGVTLVGSQAFAQGPGTNPPGGGHNESDHHPHGGLFIGDPYTGAWIGNIRAVRNVLAAGNLRFSGADARAWTGNINAVGGKLTAGNLGTVAGQPICREAQAELLGFLAGTSGASGSGTVSTCLSSPAKTADGAPMSARSAILTNLTSAGAPAREAAALTDAVAGLLAKPKDTQLDNSIDRFNRLVGVAPDGFLANPPVYFLAIHAVLAQLVGVTGTK